MKKPLLLHTSRRMACFIVIFSVGLFVSGPMWADTIPVAMVVQVKKSAVREYASVVAPVVRMVKFQEPVLFWGSKDGWAKVQLPGSSKLYFMFESALVARAKIDDRGSGGLGSGQNAISDAASGVTSPEIVLAGKGFDASLEAALEDAYTQGAHIDYAWVNQMERWGYSPNALADFIVGAP